jgi:hypothetical protein
MPKPAEIVRLLFWVPILQKYDLLGRPMSIGAKPQDAFASCAMNNDQKERNEDAFAEHRSIKSVTTRRVRSIIIRSEGTHNCIPVWEAAMKYNTAASEGTGTCGIMKLQFRRQEDVQNQTRSPILGFVHCSVVA